ncbi:hypothetical protein D3C76_1134950 [compost metagenome]
MHPAGRVDRADALGHHLDLGLAHRAIEGVDLPVGVGHADVVQVEQGNLADPAARQRLGRPRADAADTDDRHMAGSQALQAFAPVQAGDATETLIVQLHIPPLQKTGRAFYREAAPASAPATLLEATILSPGDPIPRARAHRRAGAIQSRGRGVACRPPLPTRESIALCLQANSVSIWW